MYWTRDSGLYKTPVVKVLLVWTSASSLVYMILTSKNYHSVVLWMLRLWAVPSAGQWLLAAMVLYSSRVLERRYGSGQLTSLLVSAGGLAAGIAALLCWGGARLHLTPGACVHGIAGILAVEYLHSIHPLHSHTLLGIIPYSSNLLFYMCVLLFSASSRDSMLAAICGAIAGLVVHHTTTLPCPPLPAWLGKLLLPETPPSVFSGASLEVQRQQRMEQLERAMMTMHQRQRPEIRVIHRPQPPSDQQVQQLTSMGFPRRDVYQALQATGSNVPAAIQLLTSRTRT